MVCWQSSSRNSDVKTKSGSISIPCIPWTCWRVFPSQNIPLLFNYGHVHYYPLESIQNVADHPEDKEDGLGHMTDKPLKNGRKYVDSGFVHDMMDTVNGDHYLVRAHVWPSMRAELPHNVVVVLSVNSGAVLHASCDPCRASSLGRCSHVVAVLFCILDHVQKHGTMLKTPCTSQECSWNKGKKRNKNPRRVSDATYPSKRSKQTLSVIEFDPRPARYREVNEQHINKFLRNIQALSQAEDTGVSMWETQLQFTYSDYVLDCERKEMLLKQVKLLYNNLKPEALMEMPATQEQSKSERWFCERWCRLTASRCLGAFKVGKLVSESQPNAAIEANKFIANQIWGLASDHFQTYWMRYGLESEPKAIVNLCQSPIEQPSLLTSSIFLDALEDWQHSPDSQSGRNFSNKPAEEIPFNEDVTFDEHGHADTSWLCAGLFAYNKLVSEVQKLDIGKVYSVKETRKIFFSDNDDDENVSACYRDLREYLPCLVAFYLTMQNARKDALKWFGETEVTFLVAFGGDGCPFGKNESACSFLVSLLYVGKRVASSSDNFLVFGANIEESSIIAKRYVQSVCKQIADLEGKVFEINGLHVNFQFEELPNDMKMLAMLGGELSNSSTYFSTFANVSTKDCADLRRTFGSEPQYKWKPWVLKKG
ncbi:hypothetical protein AWC38_SpisGene20362 [Stylophora pistillata]|uniref:SWIM-type domain-containing protein n=1 Tax=Stylophora pistillata TaxID=50429 RepID=A0A2B4RGE9_STYPI|nr:hypothetical protein AWC38_SpisGene20362 [Stylophora pistillata]